MVPILGEKLLIINFCILGHNRVGTSAIIISEWMAISFPGSHYVQMYKLTFIHLTLSSFSVFSAVPLSAVVNHSPPLSALITSPDNQQPCFFQGPHPSIHKCGTNIHAWVQKRMHVSVCMYIPFQGSAQQFLSGGLKLTWTDMLCVYCTWISDICKSCTGRI